MGKLYLESGWLAMNKAGEQLCGDHVETVNLEDSFIMVLADGLVQAVLDPAADSLDRMEAALSALYGPVSLQRCRSRSGAEQIVLLKEPEPPGPGEGR